MTRAVLRLLLAALLAVSASLTPAFAQGSAASLSGVVTDTAGGVVPGATVVVKNVGTNVTLEAVTNSSGTFNFPAMDAGTYTVTVSLQGFKTAVITDVRVVTGVAASVAPKLELGSLTETVEVKGGAELIQTSSTSVTSTISVEQLSKIPLNSRNALYAVALLPGVSTTGGPRTAGINGLPNNTVNITIDGVNTGNMLQSTDGFFSMVTPRMDAVEEITVTGAVPGAGAGAGSVQIQMTTRSGSNRFDGSLYHFWRAPEFNSNYYFNKINNLAKNEVVAHQYGFRQGGPIVIPGLFDGRGKAFFFFNYEHLYQPSSATRDDRRLLRPEAQEGIFGYVTTVAGQQVRNQVDLFALAQANGQIATKDPLVMKLLNEIRAAAATTGTINDTNAGNTLEYVFQAEGKGNQYSPTTRLDFNLTDRHRLSAAYWFQRFTNTADLLNGVEPVFPGLPNYGTQNSYRTTGNSTLRSTFGSNIVNELKGGFQWSPNDFFSNVTREQFANQDYMALSFPISSSPSVVISPGPRNTTTWSVGNTLNWLKGAHSLAMGGEYAGIYNRLNGYTVVPNVVLGFDANLDPARGMFNTTNFPSATGAQLTEARALYALLTGRVASIAGTARLNEQGEYVYNGDLARKSRQTSFAAFVQDSWRVSPALTINGGLRWDLHLPFTPADGTWSLATIEDACGMSGLGNGPGGRPCNIFNPNANGGQLVPDYDRFEPGTPAHRTNWVDFAPNIGVAWRPDVQDGFLRTLLGDPDQATIRAGYAMSFNQERIDRFTGSIGNNPGGSIAATRNNGTGFPLVLPGESHPVLLSERNRLGPPAFPTSPVYPILAASSNSVNLFPQDRNLKTPRVHSYSFGIQRSLGSDMAVEVRYVGNRNNHRWANEGWNEVNYLENGFMEEFKLAQANLQANVAAGMANRGFAYTGIPGTSPLPIHLAYLNGSKDSANPAAYTSTNFTSSTFVNRFSPLNPFVAAAAAALHGTATFRSSAISAGMPENFFVMNPRALGGVNVVDDSNWTQYDSLQVELRRRLAQGLLVSANYTYGIKKVSQLETLRKDRISVDASDDRNSPHVFKMNWTYEVPVGRGRRFGAALHPILNGILGDWEFSGNGRVQADRYRMAGFKLVGMTKDELQDAFKIRIVKDPVTQATRVYSFPQDIIDNTWAAFSVDPTTPTGYSIARGVPTGRYIAPASDANCIQLYRYDCGAEDFNLNGPLFSRWDMRLTKRFPITGRLNVEFTAEVLNVFDTINFNHVTGPFTGEDAFRVTTAYTDINTTFDPGGRIGQLAWRINW